MTDHQAVPTVAIGISTAEQARSAAFYITVMMLEKPDGACIIQARSAVISENRNYITKAALARGATHILYLDDDHLIPSNTLIRLLAADKDVVSALYTQRQPPFNPVLMSAEMPDGTFLWKQLDPQEHGIITVAAAGAGCLLVKRKVFEALQEPYWTLGQINPASWGDDLHFCSRVRKAGFEVHCDLDAPIGHLMTGAVWPIHDAKKGWVANLMHDKGPIAEWPMPLPGDPL